MLFAAPLYQLRNGFFTRVWSALWQGHEPEDLLMDPRPLESARHFGKDPEPEIAADGVPSVRECPCERVPLLLAGWTLKGSLSHQCTNVR